MSPVLVFRPTQALSGLAIAAILMACAVFAVAAPTPVRLELTGTEWDHYGDCVLVMRLTNDSSGTITFLGDRNSPYFVRQTVRPWGLHTRKIALCGVGLAENQLPPGKSHRFTVPLLEKHVWRIRVPYRVEAKSHDAQGRGQAAWSPVLPTWTREWLDTQSTDSAKFVETKMSPPSVCGGEFTFELKNISQQTLYYAGYAKDAPYEKGPLFLMQERRGWRWKDDGRAWGGIGLAWRKIPPGASLKFTRTGTDGERPQRVGIRVFLTPAPRIFTDACRPAWWPAFPKRE